MRPADLGRSFIQSLSQLASEVALFLSCLAAAASCLFDRLRPYADAGRCARRGGHGGREGFIVCRHRHDVAAWLRHLPVSALSFAPSLCARAAVTQSQLMGTCNEQPFDRWIGVRCPVGCWPSDVHRHGRLWRVSVCRNSTVMFNLAAGTWILSASRFNLIGRTVAAQPIHVSVYGLIAANTA